MTTSIDVPSKKTGGYYKTQGYEEKASIATGHGCLNILYAINKSASARYVFVFDSLSASGTWLAGPFPVNASGGFVSLSELTGIPFSTGVYVASSSTLESYTASGADDLSITAQYGLHGS